ncbi:telomere length regulation protein TEL2 homolog isoform X2 [Fopius arisanus]|uniref:Telomere length regulation protein TEL2 homolog isoform X2 n=1 Tax=Fopius arisanus TaxID=64838 RepID=A0A9R1TN52_9HYME|nr:PREDICTED: telomere length regulation protein TEL2 homolog isoform X2 [Fopius arisanus]
MEEIKVIINLDNNYSASVEGKQMEEAGKQLLITLTSLNSVNRQEILEVLEIDIGQYTKFLPKSISRKSNTEDENEGNINELLYGKIIRTFLSTFNDNFGLLTDNMISCVENLLIVTGSNFFMLHELLISISEYFKQSTNEESMKFYNSILDKVLKSEALSSSIISACEMRNVSKWEQEEYEKSRQDYIQILISLPSKVANKMKDQVPETFSINNYSTIISFQIVRAMLYLHEELNTHPTVLDLRIISSLISKGFLNFGAKNFSDLIKIMISWCLEDENSLNYMVHDILDNITRAAIPFMTILLLENIENPRDVEKVFQGLMAHDHWKFILTKKMLFFSYFNNDKIIINLINCLFSNGAEEYLTESIIKLLDIWGGRSAINHSTLEHHEYITKIILLSMKKLSRKLRPFEKDSIQELLFSGVAAHLENMQVEIRAIGMITGELIVNYLNEDSTARLKYDYDSMPQAGATIVCKIKEFWSEKCEECHGFSSSITAEQLITNLGVKSSITWKEEKNAKAIYLDREIVKTPKDSYHEDVNDFNEKESENEVYSSNDVTENSLDSDDDLIPYDMSNDRKSFENIQPLYLRQLKENLFNLSDNADPTLFSESLQCSEKLILSQLSNDDPSFALELLKMFSKLTEISYVDNFDTLKFRACVAITKIHPKLSAEYLCEEFHAPIGSHSVNDRIFFLRVLAETARELSKIIANEKHEDKIINNTDQCNRRLVSKPISLLLNSEIGKKIETLYDDDFEISSHLDNQSLIRVEESRNIISQRIQLQTKIFAHSSEFNSRGKTTTISLNKFNDVASYFFYPLLYGIQTSGENVFHSPKHFEDHGNLLLMNFIKTLSIIMISAENCIIAPKMAREILEFAWTMRFHEQAMVRCSIIECIAAVIVTVQKSHITGEIFDLLLELRIWLMDMSEESSRGDPHAQCKSAARNVISLINSLFPSFHCNV